MKKLLLFVVLVFPTILTTKAQAPTDDSTKYIWYKTQYGLRQSRIASDSFMLPPYGDTTGRRPHRPGALMMHLDKKFYKWDSTNWTLSGSTPQNIQQTLDIGDTAKRPINYTYSADTTDDIYTWKAFPSNYLHDYGPEGIQSYYSAGWHRGNGVNASGRPNIVYNWFQYNTSNGGGRINSGDAAARFGFETHFNTGGQRLFEIHVPEVTLYNGTIKRPFTMYMNKETGGTQFNYYSTTGVDYQNPSGQGLLSFGGNGGMDIFGRPGSCNLTLQDDNGAIFRQLLLNGGGIQHLSYGGSQFFDSQIEFNNQWNNLPVISINDNRTATANNIGLRISVSGTSQSKTPIQVEANTTGGIESTFINGSGESRMSITGVGSQAKLWVNNLNPDDPAGAGFNAGFIQLSAGNNLASGSLGAYYGNSNLGDIDESSLVLNTSSLPLVMTIDAFEKMRMTTGGAWLINRKVANGSELFGVNGPIDIFSSGTLFSRKQNIKITTSPSSSLQPLRVRYALRKVDDSADSLYNEYYHDYGGQFHTSGDGSGSGWISVRVNGTVCVKSGTTLNISATPVASADSVFVAGAMNTSGGADQINTREVQLAPMLKYFKGTTTWQPGIVSAGSSASTTVTVTGVSVNDVVHVTKATGGYSNGEVYDAWVSASNTVTIRVHNVSGGSANYNTTETYNVIVLKY